MPHTIEVLSLGGDYYDSIRQSINILNYAQRDHQEFIFIVPPDRLTKSGVAFRRSKYYSGDVFDYLKKYSVKAKGQHPYMIGVVNAPLYSDKLSNLFGTHRARKGLAVTTLDDHARYVGSPVSYLCYYFIRYALSFVEPELKSHEKTRGCFFDKKRHKGDLLISLQSGKICSPCMRVLKRRFSPEIQEAIYKMITALKDFASGDNVRTQIVSARGTSAGGDRDSSPLVFISYSHADKRFLDQLLVHLKPLERARRITKWSDKDIAPGSEWEAEIDTAIDRAGVAVMLATPHFLASDFINDRELGPLLQKAVRGRAKLLWVPVRACAYKESPLAKYHSLIPPEKPIAEMRAERDRAWVKVCEGIKRAVNC